MGRPPMFIGTFGRFRFSRTETGWRAKARYRGHDGVIRDLSRSASSNTKAEQELKRALAVAL